MKSRTEWFKEFQNVIHKYWMFHVKITNLCRRKENKDLNENKFRIDIGFQNLSVQLRDGRKILQNVCGEFKNGRLTAIMGLSGSGKT
jgi:ABC-type transport system involved in cytochrome bd biosynthesis fused ATPase/permease subunit